MDFFAMFYHWGLWAQPLDHPLRRRPQGPKEPIVVSLQLQAIVMFREFKYICIYEHIRVKVFPKKDSWLCARWMGVRHWLGEAGFVSY